MRVSLGAFSATSESTSGMPRSLLSLVFVVLSVCVSAVTCSNVILNGVTWGTVVQLSARNATLRSIAVDPATGELALGSFSNVAHNLVVLDADMAAQATAEDTIARYATPMFVQQNVSYPPFCPEVSESVQQLPIVHPFLVTSLAYRSPAVVAQASAAPAQAMSRLLFANYIPRYGVFELDRPLMGNGKNIYENVSYRVGSVSSIVGNTSTCTYINRASLANNTRNTTCDLRYAKGLVVDSRTGDLYLSQPYSVAKVDASTGEIFYYFGNESRPGTNTDAFNYAAVMRWDATTNNPQQLALDEYRGLMYVAEGDLYTVRRIDMATGVASVLTGKMLYDTFPPAVCVNDNCTMDDMVFVFVSGLALHHVSASETWLFVFDFTTAVVYRMVLETGRVSTIAGEPLRCCTKTTLLSGAGHLAVWFNPTTYTGSLFIAARGLQRVTWTQPLPPRPPVTTTGTDVTTVSSVVVAGLGGGISTTEAITMVLMSSAMCSQRAVPTSPVLQNVFFFGKDQSLRSAPDATTPWLLLGVCLIFFLCHFIGVVVSRCTAGSQPGRKSWREAAAFCQLPSYSIVVYDFLTPLAVYSGVRALAHPMQSSDGVGVSAAGTAVALLATLGIRISFQRHSRKNIYLIPRVVNPVVPAAASGGLEMAVVPSSSSLTDLSASFSSSFTSLLGLPSKARRSEQLQKLETSFSETVEQDPTEAGTYLHRLHTYIRLLEDRCMPTGYWKPIDVAKQWGPLFAKMNHDFPDGKAAEQMLALVAAVLTAVASVFHSGVACRAVMWLLAALFSVAAVVVALKMPYRLPLENAFSPASFVMLSVLAALRAADGEENAINVIQLLNSLFLVGKSCAQFMVWWRDSTVRELHLAQGKSYDSAVNSPVSTMPESRQLSDDFSWSRNPSDDLLPVMPLQHSDLALANDTCGAVPQLPQESFADSQALREGAGSAVHPNAAVAASSLVTVRAVQRRSREDDDADSDL